MFRINVAVIATTLVGVLKFHPNRLMSFLCTCVVGVFCYGTLDNLGNPLFLTDSHGSARLIRSGKDLRISRTPSLGPFYLALYVSWAIEAAIAVSGNSAACWLFVFPALYLMARVYKFYSIPPAPSDIPSHKLYAQVIQDAHGGRTKTIIR